MNPKPFERFLELRPWTVLVTGSQSGSFNMALDEVLLDEVSRPEAHAQTYLRFYQWIQPTLSLGFSQKAERVVDFQYCKLNGIDVVRRPTGGKAVLHHRELTYSVVSNDPAFFPIADISLTYRTIAKALQQGFLRMGIETTLAQGCGRGASHGPTSAACFAVSNHHEVLWQNRKLAGSAQRRARNAFLQHGSIMMEFDADPLSKALRLRDAASLDLAATDLKTCLGRTPYVPELLGAMLGGFEAIFNTRLVSSELSQTFSKRAREAADERGSVWD